MFEARENASDQVATAFCFEADWLRLGDFSGSNTHEIKQNLGNPV